MNSRRLQSIELHPLPLARSAQHSGMARISQGLARMQIWIRLMTAYGSFASDPGAAVLRAMSAMPPIATELMHRGEMTRWAKALNRFAIVAKVRLVLSIIPRGEIVGSGGSALS